MSRGRPRDAPQRHRRGRGHRDAGPAGLGPPVGPVLDIAQQHALADRPGADHGPAQPHQLQRRVPDDGTGQALRGTRRGDTRQQGTFGGGQGGQGAHGLPQVPAQQPARLERAEPPGRGPAQPGQLLERTGADGRRARTLPPYPRRHVPQLMPDPAAQLLQLGRPGRVLDGEVLTGQPGRAQRQRRGEVRQPAPPEGHLQRTAADVEQRERARLPAEPAAGRQERQLGLRLARQRAHPDPGPVRHPLQDLLAVRRLPHHRGRERQGARGPPPQCRVTRLGHRLDQPLHRLLGDGAVRTHLFGQTQLPLDGVHRQRNTPLHIRDHQSHRVRPRIHQAQPHGRVRTQSTGRNARTRGADSGTARPHGWLPGAHTTHTGARRRTARPCPDPGPARHPRGAAVLGWSTTTVGTGSGT
ncbi:hypothetical protein SGPA1_40468 [Streptomyces misionensis JCM 4497]